MGQHTINLIRTHHPTVDQFKKHWREVLKVQIIMKSRFEDKKDYYTHYTAAVRMTKNTKHGIMMREKRTAADDELLTKMRELYGGVDNSDTDMSWYSKLHNLYKQRVNQYYNLMLNSFCQAVYEVRIYQ
jgi:hypothetical protein